MASYNVENDSVNGGGVGAGFGFGGMGLIILLLLFFAIFSGDGLFGGRGRHEAGHIPCGPTNCEIDKDVIKSMYENEMLTKAEADRVIENANNIDSKNTLIALQDSKAENIALRGQIASDAKFSALFAEIRDVRCIMAKQPQVEITYNKKHREDNDWC